MYEYRLIFDISISHSERIFSDKLKLLNISTDMSSNSNNKASAISQEEENESRRQEQGACSSDYVQSPSSNCSICYERIINVPTASQSKGLDNKCQKCLTKMSAIPSGFPFKFAGDPDKEFECAICLSIIREATELPSCNHVMCRECLVYYEEERRRMNEEEQRRMDENKKQ